MTTIVRLAAATTGCLCLAVVAMTGTGCTDSNMLSEAAFQGATARYEPGSGELYRLYDYYPDQEVYYSPFQDRYFWQDGDGWKSGAQTPAGMDISNSLVEVMELPTGRPYLMHGDVLAMHPSLETLRAQAAEMNEMDETMEPGSTPDEAFASVPTEH